MQINLTDNPQMKDALLLRLKNEFADTCLSNFVLDMVANQLTLDKAELQRRVDELVASNTQMHADNQALRVELERMTRPERAATGRKAAQADTHANNAAP
jgi:regulator of replication initiation timing